MVVEAVASVDAVVVEVEVLVAAEVEIEEAEVAAALVDVVEVNNF